MDKGTKLTLTATENFDDYTFDGWTVTGADSSITSGDANKANGAELTIGTSITAITATYKKARPVTATANPTNGGTVKVTVGSDEVAKAKKDDALTVTAEPNEGYRFTGWGNGTVVFASETGTMNPLSKTMGNVDSSITANFAQTYSVMVSTNPEGIGKVAGTYGTTGSGTALTSGKKEVVTGEKVILNAPELSGYTFKDFTIHPSATTATQNLRDREVTITIQGCRFQKQRRCSGHPDADCCKRCCNGRHHQSGKCGYACRSRKRQRHTEGVSETGHQSR